MNVWDSAVSREAWEDLVRKYNAAGGEEADDATLANMLREQMIEVEG